MLILLLGLTATTISAAPPEGGRFPKDKIVEGKPVTLKWKDPEPTPLRVRWMQGDSMHDFIPVPENNQSIKIERKGKNEIPTKLLVVPERKTLRPQIVQIDKNQTSATFQTKPISDNEIWFWGQTPKHPCPPPVGPNALGISVRMLDNTSKYHSFKGGFLWKVTPRKNDNKQNRPFYFSSSGNDRINAITSRGFTRPGTAARAICQAHTGGSCPFVFRLKERKFGTHNRIKITPKPLEKSDVPCPEY